VYNAIVRGGPKSRGIYTEAVNRVIQSETFRNSEALRQLLSYLADKTIAGEADDLKEFTIGVEALGRPSGYDPQTDPSVRVQVGRLRRKLIAYYEGDGVGDPVCVDVPKGHFSLEFIHSEAARSAPSLQPAVATGWAANPWRKLSLVLALALLALTLVLIQGPEESTALRAASGTEFTSEMRTFWAPCFENGLPTVVSLGVAMFVRVPALVATDTTYMRQSEINSWPLDSKMPGLAALRSAIGPASAPDAIYNFSGVGEAIGSYLLGKNLAAGGLDAPIVRSPFLAWDTVIASNVIFVGAPKFNPHIHTGEFERNFRVVSGGVKNIDPLPGEPSFFSEVEDHGRPVVVHAVISRFHHGSRRGAVTVFASNDGSGTWGAVEYLTRPDLARKLVERLRGEDGKMPDSFEVVVRVRCDEEHPLDIEYVTHRAY